MAVCDVCRSASSLIHHAAHAHTHARTHVKFMAFNGPQLYLADVREELHGEKAQVSQDTGSVLRYTPLFTAPLKTGTVFLFFCFFLNDSLCRMRRLISVRFRVLNHIHCEVG